MCGGPDNVTQTTNTRPGAAIEPSIYNAAQRIDRQVNESGSVPSHIGPALSQLYQRGHHGSPLTDSAQGLVQNTIQGDYLNSNPYLDQTFNRAADLTRTRLSSEFAGSGRDAEAAMPARSDELQTLASNIYGQNYQQERNRQMNAANQSIPLANQDYADIGNMISASNLPIDTLINRIQALAPAAGGSSTTSQPLHSNPIGGGIGGALAGARLGSAIPGLGTGLGALGGGLLGLFGS